jgi:predicted protein tyrosine phosphatase
MAAGPIATNGALNTMIHVCPLSRLEATVSACGAGHVVSLLTVGTVVDRPAAIALDNHLFLGMHDIVEPMADMQPPAREHVEQLLAFASRWDREKPVVVHCFAGISRSTAAALIIAAALAPERDERELARALRRASPSATPNSRLIAIADDMLDRQGRLIEAVAEIGRGVEAVEGVPFVLEIFAADPGPA